MSTTEPLVNKRWIIVWSAIVLVMASPLIPWGPDPAGPLPAEAVEELAETPEPVRGFVTTETSPGVWEVTEDDPRFDCRTMGNQACGVLIEDVWYLVHFQDGQPVSVTER